VRGQGVGKALVARLIEDATARGMRQMIAVRRFGECRFDWRAREPGLSDGWHIAFGRGEVRPPLISADDPSHADHKDSPNSNHYMGNTDAHEGTLFGEHPTPEYAGHEGCNAEPEADK
jgi:hypothetical protein